MDVGGQGAGQLQVGKAQLLLAALDLYRNQVSLVLVAQQVKDLRLPHDRRAVDFRDLIARLDPGASRRRIGTDAGNGGRGSVDVGGREIDAEEALFQVLPFLEP